MWILFHNRPSSIFADVAKNLRLSFPQSNQSNSNVRFWNQNWSSAPTLFVVIYIYITVYIDVFASQFTGSTALLLETSVACTSLFETNLFFWVLHVIAVSGKEWMLTIRLYSVAMHFILRVHVVFQKPCRRACI
jgi:hypothetical protein